MGGASPLRHDAHLPPRVGSVSHGQTPTSSVTNTILRGGDGIGSCLMGGSIVGAPARRATLEIVYAGAGSLSGLSCCVCSKGNSFRTAAAYQRHMREHYRDPEFVFSCMICEKHYGTAAGVSGHYPSCKAKAKVTAGTTVGTTAGDPTDASDTGRGTPETSNPGDEVRTYAEVVALSPRCAQPLPSSSPISGRVIVSKARRELPVKCNVCNSGFTTYSGMRLHLLRSHPVEYNKSLGRVKRAAYEADEMTTIARAESGLMVSGTSVVFINQKLMGILPPDFIGLERLRKIRQNPRYRDLLSELMYQRREAAVDAPQSVDRRDETRSPCGITKTNSEPVGLMVTQDQSDPLRPSENASALAGTAVACASSSRVEDDDGFSRCMETDILVKSPVARPDPNSLPGAVLPIFKRTAQVPGQGAPRQRRNAGSCSKLLFAAPEPANVITTLGVCGKRPVKKLVSPGELAATVTRSRGGPAGPESPKDQPSEKLRQQKRADDCLGGASSSQGTSDSGAGESRQAAGVELNGEVCPAQGVKAGPLEPGADLTEARCGRGTSREIVGVAVGSPAGSCVADGADREPRGRSPGAEPFDEEYQKMVSLHRHILNLSTEGADLPLVPQLNNIISTEAVPGVDGRNPQEILEAIESLLREQRPALYTERPPRRAGRRRGGPEVEENLRPRQRRRREYARTQRAFRRNPREVALDILGEGGPQGDDVLPRVSVL